MELEIRTATAADWPIVQPFFRRNFREGHPFRNRAFWEWHVRDPDASLSVIVVSEGSVVAHRAVNFGGGCQWGMMLYVEPSHRGQRIVSQLLAQTAHLAEHASTNANRLMESIYRRRRWHRSADLVRSVAVRPGLSPRGIVAPIDTIELPHPSGHYWSQPGIRGVKLESGTAVAQLRVGGLRAVDVSDPQGLLEEAWNYGFRWVDYVTSWNDWLLDEMDPEQWLQEDDSPVPWSLDPIRPGSLARIRVYSENPLPVDLVIRRTYSDHGRVGSLPEGEVDQDVPVVPPHS